jgi:hypothetical protein
MLSRKKHRTTCRPIERCQWKTLTQIKWIRYKTIYFEIKWTRLMTTCNSMRWTR